MFPRRRLATEIPLLLLCAAQGGCLAQRRSEYRVSESISITQRSPEADQLWEAIQETLRRHRFPLDRVDRRAGVITSRPVTSQHFFEFWRHDVDTRYDLVDATLNPTRRRVEVSVTAAEEQTWTQLAVVVHKQRLSSPDRQFNSTGAAYQYFGDSLPSTTGLIQVTSEYDEWLDRGRDPAMEARLLRAISRRASMTGGKSVAAEAGS